MARNASEYEVFWHQVDQDLGQTPLESEIQHNSFYSEDDWDVYEVRYSGLGGYHLFAWLSIPRRDGPFPGLIQMPGYNSSVDMPYTPLRNDAVVLDPSYRGQRRSEIPFEAYYPGLLTEGIGNSDTYILRPIYADVLRAVDLLLEQTSVNPRRIAAIGEGLGGNLALVAGAYRNQMRALAVGTPLMVGSLDLSQMAVDYPLEEINDYIRFYPERREAVLSTLENFSPLGMAALVKCPVLLSVGARDQGQCPPPLGEELGSLLSRGELHKYAGGAEGGGYEHSLVRMRWLREQLDLV